MEADFAAIADGSAAAVHTGSVVRRNTDIERPATFERNLRYNVDRPVEEVLSTAHGLSLRDDEMRFVRRDGRMPGDIVVRVTQVPVCGGRSRSAPSEGEAERTVDRLVEREGEKCVILVFAARPRLHRQVVVAAVLVPVAEAEVTARGTQPGRDVGSRAVHGRRRHAFDRPRAVRAGIEDILAVAVGRRFGHNRKYIGQRDASVETG